MGSVYHTASRIRTTSSILSLTCDVCDLYWAISNHQELFYCLSTVRENLIIISSCSYCHNKATWIQHSKIRENIWPLFWSSGISLSKISMIPKIVTFWKLAPMCIPNSQKTQYWTWSVQVDTISSIFRTGFSRVQG